MPSRKHYLMTLVVAVATLLFAGSSTIPVKSAPTVAGLVRSALFIDGNNDLTLWFCGTDLHQDVYVHAWRNGNDFGIRPMRVDFGSTEQCAIASDLDGSGGVLANTTYFTGVALASGDAGNVCSSSQGLCDNVTSGAAVPKLIRSTLSIDASNSLNLWFCGTNLHQNVFIRSWRDGQDFGLRLLPVNFGTTEGCATAYNLANGAVLPGTTYYTGVALNPSDIGVVCGSTRGLCDNLTTPPPVPTYSISGRIADSTDTSVAGVSVSLSGGATATTDANGNFSFSGLGAGSYTLTPSKSGYTFNPANRVVGVPPDAANQNFTAISAPIDNIMPDGNITSPANGSTIGPSTVSFAADAWDDAGGSGVNRVEFNIAYDGSWHLVGTDTSAPYGINWSTPNGMGTQQLAFTIHVIDNAGNRKMDPGGYRYIQYNAPPLSIGFVVNRDGYSFSNYGGVNYNDYTIDDMRRAFGDSAVCRVVIRGWCWVRSVAQEWNDYVNEAVDGGHCYGMAVTSFRFFKGVDNPSSFQSGASTPYQLRLDSARRNIAYYSVEQFYSPAKDAIAQSSRNTPNTILNQLRANLSNGAPDPAILAVWGREGGHAVTPYAIEDRGGGVYWIKVYDNNHPNDTSRHVIVNTAANTWSYDLGGLVWTGTANSRNMAIVPMTKNPEHPVCPWCNSALNVSSSPIYAQVFLSGQGHILVTDNIGRRIGFVGDQFVSEIPDAYESPFIGGLGLYREPAYNLPLTLTYSILIDGSPVTGTNPASLYQFGPGYAASIKDVEVTGATRSIAEFAPDGTYLSFSPSTAQEVSLSLSHDVNQASYLLKTEKFSIDAEQTVTLTNELSDGKLKITSSKVVSGSQFSSTSSWASSSGYDVEIVRTDAGGQHVFVHSGVGISLTDTHYLDYDAWDGYGSITVTVDSGSDGIVDQVLSLENQQPQKIYLPLVVNKYVAVTADFTATPVFGTVPLTVTFANTSLGAYTSSLWDFGDGLTSTVISPTHVYTQAGTYSVTLTVSGEGEVSTKVCTSCVRVLDVLPDLIVNGNFEADTAWQIDNSTGHGGYTASLPHAGQRSIRLGVLASEPLIYGFDSATQLVTIPAGATDVSLSFWYWPRRETGTAPLTENRQLVQVLDANHNVLQILLSTSEELFDWQHRTFDLTAYAGKTIYIQFAVFNNGDFRHKRTAMYVDDVSVTMIPAARPVTQRDYPR